MAKKKLDKSKPQPTIAEIETLRVALDAYSRECAEAIALMKEKGQAVLTVSNWDTAHKAMHHVDKFIRQMVPAAKFGHFNERILELYEADISQQAATAESDQRDAALRKKQSRKGGAK